MQPHHPKRQLHGRQRECAALDQLLTDVRVARSQVLVVRGEAGVGKTALLEHLATNATMCRLVRAAGIESEMELPYAGVHQLCTPLLDHLPRLPAPQRNALETAFGLSAGSPPDRFLVGLAVLSLLSDVAEKQPIICLFDDAQWLDHTSTQILAFVARRLLAESVAMIFSLRLPCDELEFRGLPTLTVVGLPDAEARALLEGHVMGRVDAAVADRLIAETLGNPLALLQLSAGLSAAELAGGFVQPDARPLASRIEESFAQRVGNLPKDCQTLMLVAAADPVGDVALVWRAATLLGIGTDALGPAKDAGLIEFGARVRFSHPLVRSASYRMAALRDRQAVHRALAEATDPEADPDRRVWHRAIAADGLDEAVAQALEDSADRARRRGGVAAAGAFLQRATELTPDIARRGARALAAARAKFDAAQPESASQLLVIAELCPLNDLQRALVARLRAEIVFARRRGNDAPQLLLDAARRFEGLDDLLARETYLEAFAAAIYAGRLGRSDVMREIAVSARAAVRGAVQGAERATTDRPPDRRNRDPSDRRLRRRRTAAANMRCGRLPASESIRRPTCGGSGSRRPSPSRRGTIRVGPVDRARREGSARVGSPCRASRRAGIPRRRRDSCWRLRDRLDGTGRSRCHLDRHKPHTSRKVRLASAGGLARRRAAGLEAHAERPRRRDRAG